MYTLFSRLARNERHKSKVKESTSGVPFGRASYSSEWIFHAPGAKLWHNATELRTLSVIYPWCGLTLTKTTDNLSKICPIKLTDFCLFVYHRSYTILQGSLISPMAFTSCHDQGLDLLPPDGRASALTTQPIRLK